jgi:hypothetical protein
MFRYTTISETGSLLHLLCTNGESQKSHKAWKVTTGGFKRELSQVIFVGGELSYENTCRPDSKAIGCYFYVLGDDRDVPERLHPADG